MQRNALVQPCPPQLGNIIWSINCRGKHGQNHASRSNRSNTLFSFHHTHTFCAWARSFYQGNAPALVRGNALAILTSSTKPFAHILVQLPPTPGQHKGTRGGGDGSNTASTVSAAWPGCRIPTAGPLRIHDASVTLCIHCCKATPHNAGAWEPHFLWQASM